MLVAVAVLVALGTWQLERRAWKEALIAELEGKLAAPPAASAAARTLAAAHRRERMNSAASTFPAEFLGEEALVYSSGSAMRPDATAPATGCSRRRGSPAAAS